MPWPPSRTRTILARSGATVKRSAVTRRPALAAQLLAPLREFVDRLACARNAANRERTGHPAYEFAHADVRAAERIDRELEAIHAVHRQ
jgi:hypothetical protein